MKSLRYRELADCGLRTVAPFVGELESLEILDLFHNDLQIEAKLYFMIKVCPCLREVRLSKRDYAPWTPESRAHLRAFKAKLLAKNPNAKVYLHEERVKRFLSPFSFLLFFFIFLLAVC